MTDMILLKTDASYKKNVGCGISYSSEVEWDGRMVQYKNSKFTKRVKNSTHAELIAAVYGIVKTLERIDNPSDYEIKIGVDCEFVVDSLNEYYPDQPKIIKTALNILNLFERWTVNWIPRTKNSEADTLARSERMRHE